MRPSLILVTCVSIMGSGLLPPLALSQTDGQQILTNIPVRKVDFRVAESDPGVSLSPITVFPPHCSTDGSLFVDMLNPHKLSEHTIVEVKGKSSLTFSPKDISDLHDVQVLDFYPSQSIPSFLVRASKELVGQKGAATSPAGIPWDEYHDYIAKFDPTGAYKGSVELPMKYPSSHFAVLPSGDAIVVGFDATNSSLQIAYIDASGQLVRKLDAPAAREGDPGAGFYNVGEIMAAGNQFVSSIYLTAFGDQILMWRRNGNDPVVVVSQGGGTREVPLPKLNGYVFVDLLTSSDRWVAHYRSEDVAETAPSNPENFVYVEMRPQDGSISARLTETGIVPFTIACESEGKYIAFLYDKDNKLQLLSGD